MQQLRVKNPSQGEEERRRRKERRKRKELHHDDTSVTAGLGHSFSFKHDTVHFFRNQIRQLLMCFSLELRYKSYIHLAAWSIIRPPKQWFHYSNCLIRTAIKTHAACRFMKSNRMGLEEVSIDSSLQWLWLAHSQFGLAEADWGQQQNVPISLPNDTRCIRFLKYFSSLYPQVVHS